MHFIRYVSVDEKNGVELFYYFIQSEGDPRHDPVLLWLTGGDRCSVLSGLAFEIGEPLDFLLEKFLFWYSCDHVFLLLAGMKISTPKLMSVSYLL